MGSSESIMESIGGSLLRQVQYNRQIILSQIYVLLSSVEPKKRAVTVVRPAVAPQPVEPREIAADLYMDKGNYTLNDLVGSIEHESMDPTSKTILLDLIVLLKEIGGAGRKQSQ